MQKPNLTETIYTCPDKIVTVVRKKRGLFDEMKAMIGPIDSNLAAKVPKSMGNKPQNRKHYWDVENSKRRLQE